ncbi:aspartate ammonia-lyase [Carboxylicivirga marina]|uniref:Aspartate ammonia-lyase n=1 Tax=Carboxylicivirga marina TaxID=2800988 RepID=A0ABS1HN19_9BACT|nr:aspartate ammonia-lyase [Carboxylicivirga marina]MBK3519077.1 aspartate ammonia-lyase [Carboxylicivirga marina]
MAIRIESDLIGELQVPVDAYYGVQTQRAVENFNISTARLSQYRHFIWALGVVKMAAIKANHDMGLVDDKMKSAVVQACKEVMDGKFDKEFPIDMIQGGAGTSTNMNANEVIANRALELMGYEKAQYEHCSPNDIVNLSQSTNDAYPTAIKLSLIRMNYILIEHLQQLVEAFKKKGNEFADVIKMGRTQLQDAVPMTLGQEFCAYAITLTEEIERLTQNANLFREVNMGATAIGTGINSVEGYSEACVKHLCNITGYPIVLASDLVEATPDTGSYVIYSSALKRMAVKISKICNDLRILSSGPRAGFNEINLPPMQPGSSIMPGKVNPVIPEVMNQICFKVIGNDLTVTFAAEAGQLQLNVMEPVLAHSILESIQFLMRGMDTLRTKCIDGITANEDVCENMVLKSIGIVTALNPHIGYKNSTRIAKEALKTGKGVYEIVLEEGILSEEELKEIFKPENMIGPAKRTCQ